MLLDVKELWCHYGGAEVLKGITLSIPEGKIVTIIGANGAGKTTALSCHLGTEEVHVREHHVS